MGALVHLAGTWIAWMRERPIGVTLVKCGVIVILAFGGWAASVSVSLGDEEVQLRLTGDDGVPTAMLFVGLGVGTTLILLGGASLAADALAVRRRRVLVVEVRGLRESNGVPLEGAIPRRIGGQRVSLLVDLRQAVVDGDVTSPRAALEKLASLPSQLSQHEAAAGRGEATFVYGGLAPVPFTFLAGTLFDDEGRVVVMDWDRYAGRWRLIDGQDDGERFEVMGRDAIADGAGVEVALMISLSYRIDPKHVAEAAVGMPVVAMTLESRTPESHWSSEKQAALACQFFEVVTGLRDSGTARVHLFLAAPNSVVFRFGQHYDRRNLPPVVVYQYEPQNRPAYKWGVQMPHGGNPRPHVHQPPGLTCDVGGFDNFASPVRRR